MLLAEHQKQVARYTFAEANYLHLAGLAAQMLQHRNVVAVASDEHKGSDFRARVEYFEGIDAELHIGRVLVVGT
jgi:hypothetical protein